MKCEKKKAVLVGCCTYFVVMLALVVIYKPDIKDASLGLGLAIIALLVLHSYALEQELTYGGQVLDPKKSPISRFMLALVAIIIIIKVPLMIVN